MAIFLHFIFMFLGNAVFGYLAIFEVLTYGQSFQGMGVSSLIGTIIIFSEEEIENFWRKVTNAPKKPINKAKKKHESKKKKF